MRTYPDFCFFVMSSFRSVVSERRTMNCIWELTYRCNARCSFCSYWEKPAHVELDLAEIRAGIDNVHRSGCRLINFSGGEPTLRDDLDEIVMHASKKRIWTSVTTNGSLLDR
ncbi:MAG TPA: radical SAM protein, partial [Candidatus Krumholzibacteriaceae bacterium]